MNRENRIRTCDPTVPNRVLYQTEPFPVNIKGDKWSLQELI